MLDYFICVADTSDALPLLQLQYYMSVPNMYWFEFIPNVSNLHLMLNS